MIGFSSLILALSFSPEIRQVYEFEVVPKNYCIVQFRVTCRSLNEKVSTLVWRAERVIAGRCNEKEIVNKEIPSEVLFNEQGIHDQLTLSSIEMKRGVLAVSIVQRNGEKRRWERCQVDFPLRRYGLSVFPVTGGDLRTGRDGRLIDAKAYLARRIRWAEEVQSVNALPSRIEREAALIRMLSSSEEMTKCWAATVLAHNRSIRGAASMRTLLMDDGTPLDFRTHLDLELGQMPSAKWRNSEERRELLLSWFEKPPAKTRERYTAQGHLGQVYRQGRVDVAFWISLIDTLIARMPQEFESFASIIELMSPRSSDAPALLEFSLRLLEGDAPDRLKLAAAKLVSAVLPRSEGNGKALERIEKIRKSKLSDAVRAQLERSVEFALREPPKPRQKPATLNSGKLEMVMIDQVDLETQSIMVVTVHEMSFIQDLPGIDPKTGGPLPIEQRRMSVQKLSPSYDRLKFDEYRLIDASGKEYPIADAHKHLKERQVVLKAPTKFAIDPRYLKILRPDTMILQPK